MLTSWIAFHQCMKGERGEGRGERGEGRGERGEVDVDVHGEMDFITRPLLII